MTIEEAKKVVEQTRSFVGRIFANEVVLDGPFKPLELEAILFIMRNRPAPPEWRVVAMEEGMRRRSVATGLISSRRESSTGASTHRVLWSATFGRSATSRRGQRHRAPHTRP